MVPLATVHSSFHARVIAARIGSEGIVCELQGAVDGPYPMGDVRVMVPEDELADAQELLLADDVESAFDDDDGSHAPPLRLASWLLAGTLAMLLFSSILRHFG